jgi:hypothetical protein
VTVRERRCIDFFDAAQLELIIIGSLWLTSSIARVIQWNAGICFPAMLCTRQRKWRGSDVRREDMRSSELSRLFFQSCPVCFSLRNSELSRLFFLENSRAIRLPAFGKQADCDDAFRRRVGASEDMPLLVVKLLYPLMLLPK